MLLFVRLLSLVRSYTIRCSEYANTQALDMIGILRSYKVELFDTFVKIV
jgi:hypothetical protein